MDGLRQARPVQVDKCMGRAIIKLLIDISIFDVSRMEGTTLERTFHMLLYRAFHAQRAFLRPKGAALGLGTGQPKLIAYLEQNGPCSQKHLAEYFEVDPAAVCRMLDTLEKGGFICRTADRADRRTGMVELTEKGREAALSWQGCCDALEERMLEGFSPEERRQFADYLTRAHRNLRKREE